MNLDQMAQDWLAAKRAEAEAIANRRAIEDAIKAAASIPETLDGTSTLQAVGYTIKVVGRIDRKVDADLVQELAAEHGLTEHLGSLFRWKPEINSAVWKAADESITRPLAAAITAKPGRPSFSITVKES